MKPLRIAVQGCCHGELNVIYQKLRAQKVDLLIITGDFQAIRNVSDLQCMAVPQKYKRLGDFHRYYTGQKLAPIPTVFIGGNHESSGYLKELKYGGWVSPNIYYLGEFGTIWYKGLKIGGLSGIYNETLFNKNPTTSETLPLNASTLRSIYHIKPKNYVKLLLMQNQHDDFDIVLSHDWPQFIYNYGDKGYIMKQKPYFKADMESGKLGSPVSRNLLNHLSPRFWFSSHLHLRFETKVEHIDVPKQNLEEIDLDMDMDMMSSSTEPDSSAKQSTHFLALDKCGKHRRHLEIMEINPHDHVSSDKLLFYYDPRSVAVNKVVETFIKEHESEWLVLTPDQLLNFTRTKLFKDLCHSVDEEMSQNPLETLEYVIPNNFCRIAPGPPEKPELRYWQNNQTKEYCQKFDVP